MSSKERTVRGDISKHFLCFQTLHINKLQYVASRMEVKQMIFFTECGLSFKYCLTLLSCLYAPLAIISFFSILSPSEIHVRTEQLAVVFETYFKNVIYKVKDIALLQPLKESLTASRINLTI